MPGTWCHTLNYVSTRPSFARRETGGQIIDPRQRPCAEYTALPLLLQQGCVLQVLMYYMLLVLCCLPAAGDDTILVFCCISSLTACCLQLYIFDGKQL